jgi:hypothetical protein
MAKFTDIFKTKQGKIFISIIWGLGLSCLFRQTCKGRNCILYKAPNNEEVQKNIYRFNNQCFRYKARGTECTDDTIKA